MLRRAVTKGQNVYWSYRSKSSIGSAKNNVTKTNKHTQSKALKEKHLCYDLSKVMSVGIIGGFLACLALGVWLYLVFFV
jgi:hypothetical protein